MAILKKILFSCIPVMILTGCYSDFNPEEYSRPVLCINSVISAGEPIDVSVSRTWRYNAPLDSAGREVKDARIHVYVNGRPENTGYIASEGDEVRIVAESEEYGKAEATVNVPYAVPIEEVEFHPYGVRVWTWNGDDYPDNEECGAAVSFNFEVLLRISDLRPGRDYFRLWGESYTSVGLENGQEKAYNSGENSTYAYLRMGEFDYNSDMIFKEHIGIAESMMGGYEKLGMFFTDHAFSGSDYTVCLRFEGVFFEASWTVFEESLLDCGITFDLLSISESYYERMNYLWQKNSGIIGDLADLGLSDPIWGYSNVSSGAGVVVAKSITTCDLNLKDFLKEALDGSIQ